MASWKSKWRDLEPILDALQELLADLGSASSSASSSHTHPHLTCFNVDLANEKYGGFFQQYHRAPSNLKTADEKRWLEVRLQVLAAIGQCNTLKMIRLQSNYGIGEKGRVKELETLWGGVEQASKSNTSSLQELFLGAGLGSEAACEALGGVLSHSRTLRLLNLSRSKMDASGLVHLRSALGANPHSALRDLDLSKNKVGGGSTGDAAGGAALVAALLRLDVCPSLQHLKMVRIGLDGEGAQLIGQALARNTTLRRLCLGRDDPAAMLLLVRTGLGQTENSPKPVFYFGVALSEESSIDLHISGMTDEKVADVEVVVWTAGSCEEPDLRCVMKKAMVDEVNGGCKQSANSNSGSQDPEPLPVALQELLGELGGSQWPSPASSSSSHTHDLANRKLLDFVYGDFFHPLRTGGRPLGVAEETRWREVRVQVLSAIGKCSTLNTIHLSVYYDIGEDGRTEEVEALWGGLASIASYSALEKLVATECTVLGSEAACATLSGFLRHTPKLRELMLWNVGMNASGLGYLCSALEANPNSTLRVLDLSQNMVGDGGAAGGAVQLAKLLHHSVCPSLQRLDMDSIGLDVEGAETIGQALATNTSLQTLVVSGDEEGETLNVLLRTGLVWETSGTDLGLVKGNKSIISLEVRSMKSQHVSEVNLMLRTNQMLEELVLWNSTCADPEVRLEVDKARNIKSIRVHGSFSHGFNQMFFRSLRENGTLQRLEMSLEHEESCNEEIFTDLMQSLDRNTTLQEIELDVPKWEKEGKYAIVREKLRRNAGLATYLPTFYGQHLKFVTPKMSRLFLCGPPRAGKTTLRRTMVHFQTYSQQKGLVPLLRKYMRLPWNMTEGIEVEPLIHHDDSLQVSIWDLAGQAEYRVLHNYLFPNIHQACLFLFVFSPFDHVLNKIMTDNAITTKFENELRYWLKFISSNVEKRGGTKAKLLVIITHLDKLRKREDCIRIMLLIKFKNLKKLFVDVVDLSSGMELIDACSIKHIENILPKVFGTLKVLCEKAINVPEVCEKISSALMKWVLLYPSQPFMGQEEFVAFCVQQLEELKKYERADQNNIANAISSYLHDSGNIIYFKKFNLRVMNPNWITNVFLCKLIQSRDPLIKSTSQGFVEREQLEYVLTTSFLKDSNYSGLKTQDLVNIMVELELCYEALTKNGAAQGFYIPTAISQPADFSKSERCLQWLTTVEKNAEYEFLGRRLQCEDQLRTFLTEGFFPRFQVVLRNRLFSKLGLGMQSHQYTFGYNLISMVCSDIDILIECSGGGVIGDYVDILIRSKQRPGFANTFMRQHVLEELRDFCASPKGCPGVALVEGIINPYCVSELVPCDMRQNQAYLEKDYTKFLLDEKQALQCGEGYFVVRNILDLVHYWPPIGDEGNGIRVSHKMGDFVDAKNLADLVRRNAKFHEQQKDRIQKVAVDLQLVPTVSLETTTSSKVASHLTSMSSTILLLQYDSDLSAGTRSATTKYMIEKLHMILEKQDIHHSQLVDKLDHNHKEMLKAIRSVEVEVTKSKIETLRTLENRMDDIIGYHSTSIPRRPYFSDDGISIQDKLIASIHIGKAIRLHLMCEQRGGNHIVEGQSGYPMVVEEKDCKWLRKLSVNSAKLFFFLLQAGFHVAAGVGGTWSGAIPITVPALVVETLLTGRQLPNMVATDEGDAEVEGGLREVLECLKLQGQMWHLFQLKQVRYVEGKETAWLCNACTRKCSAASLIMPC